MILDVLSLLLSRLCRHLLKLLLDQLESSLHDVTVGIEANVLRSRNVLNLNFTCNFVRELLVQIELHGGSLTFFHFCFLSGLQT